MYLLGTWRNGYIVALCRCRCTPCGFESRLVQDFQRNIMFFPFKYWDIVKMVCSWARHFALKCFTWLRWKWVPGWTVIAMCMISSMRRNGCRTVCFPGSWNGTRMNRSIDQGVNVKSDDRSSDLISRRKKTCTFIYINLDHVYVVSQIVLVMCNCNTSLAFTTQ